MGKFILGIDQSTQGTKALLFDEEAKLLARADVSHKQYILDNGFIEHDPQEIYENTLKAAKEVIASAGIFASDICAVGISNQRETTLAWDKSGRCLYRAIVWQDARADEICRRVQEAGFGEKIEKSTGIRLSPYFPAAKLSWILQNVPEAKRLHDAGDLRMGTMDTYLLYRLSKGAFYKTDYSNASRTQLFDLVRLCWNIEIAGAFGIDASLLAEVCDSDSCFGATDLEGILPSAVPIHAMMGDSHAALLGQGCLQAGKVKATYGTGSSIMLNIGEKPIFSSSGLSTSIAWSLGERVEYCLEGNVNYAGAIISWMKDGLGLIGDAGETEGIAQAADTEDETYLVPAFSGLGSPYHCPGAQASFVGMTRKTTRAELVRAGLDAIAYQVADVLSLMQKELPITDLYTDGGASANRYLMQLQSDLIRLPVRVAKVEELSGFGAAFAAGVGLGLYSIADLEKREYRAEYMPRMDMELRNKKIQGWEKAIESVMKGLK